MSYAPPWKVAVVGVVAVVAGIPLLVVSWSLAQLTAYVGMFFVARGALHVVTTSVGGVPGWVEVFLGGCEFGVGVLLLAWPGATLLVLALAVGTLVLFHGTAVAAAVLATRSDVAHWKLRFVAAAFGIVLGVLLIVRPGGSVDGVALLLGVLAVLQGTVEICFAIAQQRAVRRERSTLALTLVPRCLQLGSRSVRPLVPAGRGAAEEVDNAQHQESGK